MQQVIEQVNHIRELSGNEQLNYIRDVKSDILEEVFDYTYNPDKMYKIDTGKYDKIKMLKGLIPRKKKEIFTVEDWHKFTDILDTLVDKRAVTESEVKVVKYFITDFVDADTQSFLCMVLYKDLRLNLGIKKLQTIWPDFCNKPQVQLADDYDGTYFENGLYSRKFDGKRMLIENGVAKSRYGKPCKTAPIQHILNELQEISQGKVFDGELLYFDPNGNEDFQKVISLSGSDLCSVECFNMYYVIFDALTHEDWLNQSTEVPFELEYEAMKGLLRARDDSKFGYSVLDTKYQHILLARQEHDDIIFQNERIKNKWEGLMYRNGQARYEFKRSKNILKIKDMKDGEFELKGMVSGTGRNKYRLGRLNIQFKDNIVGVGSGFHDEDRDIIWNNPEVFMDQKFGHTFNVKVQYFNETKDADGNDSLRFPVFLCFRHKETKEEFTPAQVKEWFEKEIKDE